MGHQKHADGHRGETVEAAAVPRYLTVVKDDVEQEHEMQRHCIGRAGVTSSTLG